MMKKINLKKIIQGICVITGVLLINASQAALPISEIKLQSGARLFFIQTRSIPIVDIGIDFMAGSFYDPVNKSGVSDMAASLINKGAKISGQVRTESQIADSISDRGASVSFSAGAESASLRIRALSRADIVEPLISELADMVAYPTYDASILEREKSREISALKEAQIKPEYMLSKQFKKMLYPHHPFGVSETPETIAAITVDDLKRFHRKYYQAATANVLIVGDLDQLRAVEIAERLTAQLPKSNDLPQAIGAVLDESDKNSQREIRLANPSQQAHIRIGMHGVPRNHPDYIPLMVGNYILGGGGFVSRLMTEVREKRGLAYSVSSYFYPSKTTGTFIAGMQTKKDQADQSLAVMRQTIQEFIETGPTEQELKAAKDNLVNGFPLRIDSNRKLLDNLSSIAWNGLPLDMLDHWTQDVQAVTREQVKSVFKKHLDMSRMMTVVVGAQ